MTFIFLVLVYVGKISGYNTYLNELCHVCSKAVITLGLFCEDHIEAQCRVVEREGVRILLQCLDSALAYNKHSSSSNSSSKSKDRRMKLSASMVQWICWCLFVSRVFLEENGTMYLY